MNIGERKKKEDYMSCICNKCGKPYKMDIIVLNEIWEQIKPKNKSVGAGLLCGKCIVGELEKKGYSSWNLMQTNKKED